MSEGQPLDYQTPQQPLEPPRGALGIIFLIVVMDLLGFGIIIPLLPFYVNMPQSRPFEVTLLFSVYSICQFIGAPILGMISDRLGRRPVLAFSQLGSVVGYILLGLATDVKWVNPATLLILVYISRIIDGFTGGNISTAQAYVSDVTTRANRAKGMGMLGAAFGIGFSAGPFLGGVLGAVRVSYPAYAAAAFSAIAAVLTFTRLPESRQHRPTEAEVWLHPSKFLPIIRRSALFQLLLISFCLMAAFVMMESTIGLFLNKLFGWKERQVGWYFAFIGVIIVIVQGGLIGRLTKAMGDWPLAISGPVFVALGMAGLIASAWYPWLSILLIAGAVNAVGRSIYQPTSSSLISKFSDPGEQGTVFGLYHGMSSLARVAGPILAGWTYPLLRNCGPFALAGIIALLMAAWTATLRQPAPGDAMPEATGEAALEQG
jgi:DHA1 family tetracycline resistance protein-like MFS transporter